MSTHLPILKFYLYSVSYNSCQGIIQVKQNPKPIYLDYNATTPVDAKVLKSMLPYLQSNFGNPSSSHVYGRVPKEAVEKSREQVATLIGADVDEIIFTSGGTESNNHAIIGTALANKEKGNHIITSIIGSA
jgi:cysteine desulfurase